MKKLPKPTNKLVQKYLDEWDNKEDMVSYREQENFLVNIFKKYNENKEVDKIILKVLMLDKFYSTQIRNSVSMAKGISRIKNIEDRLKKGDVELIDEIASCTGVRREYSFATKYCSFHNPKKFPIYDQYVRKILHHFKNEYSNLKLTHKDFENYNIFVNSIYDFIKYYKLEKYTIKDIDRFLWQFGKDYFMKPNRK